MTPLWILLGLLVWGLLFLGVYKLGMFVINASQKTSRKKWKCDIEDYDQKRWKFRFYTIAYFVGIPVLFLIAVFTS